MSDRALVVAQPVATPAQATNLPPTDPDDLALFEALAAVENREQGTQQPAPTQTAKPTAAAAQQPTMIPKARFDQVNDQARRNAEAARLKGEEAAYWKGVAEARAAAGGQPANPNAPAQPQAPTVSEQLAAQQNRRLVAADKFDRGELTMTEYVKIANDVENQIAQLRSAHLVDWLRANPPGGNQVGLSDQAVMQQQIESLATRYPWSTVLSEPELAFLANQARSEAAALGKPIGKGPQETVRLREMVAELAEQRGPRWYRADHEKAIEVQALRQAAAAAQPQTQAAPAANRHLTLVPANNKAVVAARQPPSVANTGFVDSGTLAVSNDRVAAMSEDEILALPPAVRSRFLTG